MLLTKEVEMTWTHANKRYFIEKGYCFTKYNDKFMCRIEDLNDTSEKKILYICDYCGEENQTSYKHYKRGKLQVDKDDCPHCAVRKAHEIRKITGKTTMAKSRYNTLKQENFILKLHKSVYDKNYMLLPYVYTNAKQKMMYVCKKHYNLVVQVATAFNLSNEPHQCKGCIYDNAKEVQGFNFDDAKYIIEKSGENKLLSTVYTHANDRNLSISCSLCGNPYTTSLQKYQDRHQIICPSCRKKISFGKNSAHWKGGRSSLNSFLRASLKEWKSDSLKAANYQCDITHKNGYLEVHHLYKNFRDVVSETLEVTHLDLRDNVGKYSQEELKLLSETCVNLHYKYGLGVCLLREYHLEFHEFYGHFSNTPEQYFLFKKEKQSELFQENQCFDSLLLCSNE